MKKISIGRSPENNLVFDSPIVSGFHATITIDDQGLVTFEDHSTNGTLVNGQKLHKQNCVIQASDCIQLAGSVQLDLSFLNNYAPGPYQENASADTAYQPTPEPETEYQHQPAADYNQKPEYQHQPAADYNQQPEYQHQPAADYNQQPKPQAYHNDVPADSSIHPAVWEKKEQQYQNTRTGAASQNPLPSVSMGKALSNFFTNYAKFSGRARRSELWWVVLANTLISFIPFVNIIYSLVVLIPCIALSVRRLHDIGKSGWFLLLNLIPIVGGIILIVWYCQDSQPYKNQFGDSPKYKG